MLLKIFKLTILLVFANFIASCATKQAPVKPLTQRERQLLYYKKLRAYKWDEITKKRNQQQRRYHKNKKITVDTRKKKVAPKPKKKSSVIPVNPNEQRIEIEQLISFHCIKERMDNCDELSTRIYEKCLQEFNPGDKRLTNCVTKALR
ncbi:putative lipoprotein [Bacteriovorax sp. BAL6_X]|uniref:hypothetical protein n=1 Tax=Bacteriovorax sp. BAL6_X TaxID=1201290 RepID=UPI000386CFD8|nr:hypothetical protein [Bacteriovorax sp. BAL6_X]EPZ51355.1 putative lipoprotein [Bacteriovorax sp. BAL6_X]